MGSATEVNDSNFEAEVVKSNIPVLADFWAEWCQPCKMLTPVVEKIASEFDGKLKVVKINVDNSPDTASSLGVRSLPTIMFFKNGGIAEQIIGVVNEVQLKKVIAKVLA